MPRVARSWCAMARAARTAGCRCRTACERRYRGNANAHCWCMRRIWRPVLVGSSCRTRWHASIPMPTLSRGGNICSRLCAGCRIRAAAGLAGTMSLKKFCSVRYSRHGSRLHRQAGDLPHLAAFVRHPSAGGRPRYPHRTGTAGAHGREHHADLHTCAGTRCVAVRSPLDGLGLMGADG